MQFMRIQIWIFKLQIDPQKHVMEFFTRKNVYAFLTLSHCYGYLKWI